jgi:hypothetical protein
MSPGDATIHDRLYSSLEVFAICQEMLLSSKISANPSWLLYEEIWCLLHSRLCRRQLFSVVPGVAY